MKKDNVLISMVGMLFHVAIVIIAVLLIRQYAEKCYNFGYRILKEPPVTTVGEGKKITITISEGVTPKSLAEVLESKGLIRDSKLFIAQFYASEYKDEIKAGTYELTSSMTAEEMFAVMAGKTLGEDE